MSKSVPTAPSVFARGRRESDPSGLVMVGGRTQLKAGGWRWMMLVMDGPKSDWRICFGWGFCGGLVGSNEFDLTENRDNEIRIGFSEMLSISGKWGEGAWEIACKSVEGNSTKVIYDQQKLRLFCENLWS